MHPEPEQALILFDLCRSSYILSATHTAKLPQHTHSFGEALWTTCNLTAEAAGWLVLKGWTLPGAPEQTCTCLTLSKGAIRCLYVQKVLLLLAIACPMGASWCQGLHATPRRSCMRTVLYSLFKGLVQSQSAVRAEPSDWSIRAGQGQSVSVPRAPAS